MQGEKATPTNDVPQNLTIIRDCGSDSVPNVSLNCHDRFHRWEIYAAALLGVLLQAGVLVFSGSITYRRPLTSSFKKDGEPVDDYAFPCAAVGTVLLAVGMLLCAVVVESSTKEDSFTTTDQETELRMVWLQKGHTTNDQVFKSFAIYPEKCRPFIRTSRRVDRLDKQRDSDKPSIDMKILTVFGTVTALAGFAVQFVGLRGLNWAASVAQLVAVIIMTVGRAVVRRGLAQPPLSIALTPGFELDWFALSLADLDFAPWAGDAENHGACAPRGIKKEASREFSNPWAVRTGQYKSDRDFDVLQEIGGRSTSESASRNHSNPPRSSSDRPFLGDATSHKPAPDASASGKTASENFEDFPAAQHAVTTRKKLANLANWRGPATNEAVRLAKAIEVVAKALLPDGSKSSFVWTLPAYMWFNLPADMSAKSLISRLEPFRHKISIDLKPVDRGWEVDTEIIDSVMSLWMYFFRSRERKTSDHGRKSSDSQATAEKKPADRLRSQAERESGLRLYGPSTLRAEIERAFHLWVPDGFIDFIMVESVSEYMELHGISCQSVVGFGPGKHVGATLALQSDDPLERLISRDLMYSFIAAVAKLPMVYFGPTVVEAYDAFNQSSKKVQLHDDKLTNLVRDLERVGYGSLSEIYLDLIIPFSIEKKLANVDTLIAAAQERAKEFESSHNWNRLTDVAVWLLDFAMGLDPDKDHHHTFIVAVCLDILRRIKYAEMLIGSERVSLDKEATSGRETLERAFRHRKLQNSSYFLDLAQIRRENWETGLLKNILHVPSPNFLMESQRRGFLPCSGSPRRIRLQCGVMMTWILTFGRGILLERIPSGGLRRTTPLYKFQ